MHPYPEMEVIPASHVLTPSLSGKTSFILSLAGELGLDIYTVSLSSKGCVLIGSFPHCRANLQEIECVIIH